MTENNHNAVDKNAAKKAVISNSVNNESTELEREIARLRKTAKSTSTQTAWTNTSTIHGNSSYRSSNSSSNWVLALLLGLVVLGIGLWIGRYWGEKKVEEITHRQTGTLDTGSTFQGATAGGSATQKPVLTVETVTPTNSVVTQEISADGTISPETTATVSGKVNGVAIEEVYVEEGDEVTRGQVLAMFDTDAMQQRITQAQAELAELRTNYTLAQKNAERIEPLIKINAISQLEADRYKATADQAAAAVKASEARLNNQNLDLENAKVTAPVSGVISSKNADVGSVPGQTPLFTIIKNNDLEWRAKIDPNQLGGVTVGTPVEVSLPDNRSVRGQVRRISPTAEQGSRQITVYVALQDSPYARAGMYQRGTFMTGSNSQLVLPVSAVVNQDGYDYVMQLTPAPKNKQNEPTLEAKGATSENTAKSATNTDNMYQVKRIKVALGARLGDNVELAEPLPTDMLIVRQGGSFLNDGDLVRVSHVNNIGNAQ